MIGPIFNQALQVPVIYRVYAVLAFFVLESCAMFVLRFLPEPAKEEEV